MSQARPASRPAPPADRADADRGLVIRASALVIDDEEPALDELSYLLRTTFSIAPVDAAQNSADAFRCLQERPYDVVFLDVRMPGLNGIELANVLRRFAAPPAIVFVTAYEEYAVRAFEIGACDYLLKPVSRARLRTALERALGRSPDQPIPPRDDDLSAMIPVEVAGRTRFIFRDQVAWAEAEGDYVRLHTTDGDAHLIRIPISHLEERWAAYGFIRIHRSYLVSIKRITEFSMTAGIHTVTVAGHSLPISRRHVREVRDRILRVGRRSLPCPGKTRPRRSSRRAGPTAVSWSSSGPGRFLSSTPSPGSATSGRTPNAAACSSGPSCGRSLACR
jgi:two-component system, LytTR family, response regulator LytT